MRRRLRRLLLLAWTASVVAVLASAGLAYFGGEGSGSVDVAVAVPSSCPSFSSVDAHALPYTDDPSATCSGSVLDFGIPGGAPGADGAPGEQGEPGPAGADSTVPGPAGPQGATGATGAQGIPGQSITSAAATDCNGTGRPGSFFNGVSGGTWACDGATGAQGPQGATGATGATGSTGPQGPQGPTGAAGSNGVSGWEKIDSPQVACAGSAQSCTTSANCSAGKKVIGGNAWQNTAALTVQTQALRFNRVSTINNNGGMEVFAISDAAQAGRTLILTIFCANVS